MISTVWLLIAEFNTSQIPLDLVAEKYLSLSPAKAAVKAKVQKLPFPVYRGESQKTQWLVDANDLAAYIDTQKAKAADTWRKMNSAA